MTEAGRRVPAADEDALVAAITTQPWQETGLLSLREVRLRTLPDVLRLAPELARRLVRGLRGLDLSGNRLTELPDWLWEMAALERLAIAGNRLRAVDPQIGRLVTLRDLDLSGNRLVDLPPSLAACVSLQRLDVSGNAIVDLSSFAELPCLVLLDAADNRIEGLDRLPSLRTLRSLDLSGNRLTSLSSAFQGLRALHRLDLSGNRLTSGALDVLSDLPVEELYLDDNALESPVDVAALPLLRRLSELGNAHDCATGGTHAADVVAQHVSGGAEPGRRYFDAPTYTFEAALSAQGPQDARRVIDLYYKRFAEISPELAFDDGTSVALGSLSRATALHLVQSHQGSGGTARVSLPPTKDAGTVARGTAFLAQAIARMDNPELVPGAHDGPGVRFDHEGLTPPVRVLNVAVTDAQRQVLPLRQALVPEQDYAVRIDIGPVATESVVINPTPIRVQDLEATSSDGFWFDVVLSSGDLDVALDRRRLFLPFSGSSWVCDCPGPDHVCAPGDRRGHLYVAIRTRAQTGQASLRCTVYNGNNVIQSVRVSVVVAAPGTGDGEIRGVTDFALADDAGRAGELPARSLNVLTNDSDSGTHTIVVNAADRAISVSLTEAESADVLAALRGKLTEIMLGKDGSTPQFDDHNAKSKDAFLQDLKELALLGSVLYAAVVPDRDDQRYLREHLAARATIQVARVTRTVFPWALVYDIRREATATWTPCQFLAEWETTSAGLADYPDGCPYSDAHRSNVLCPFGFWGFRHLIEQPPSVRRGVLRTRIKVTGSAHAAAARALTLDAALMNAHFTRLAGSLAEPLELLTCDSGKAIRAAFADPGLPLVYFYCHGMTAQLAGTQLEVPLLEVGLADRIGPGDFGAWDEDDHWGPAHWSDTAPLIFINGCETATFSPEDVVSFVEALAGVHAAGVVGTEIPVTQQVAGEVAERFLEQFAGTPNTSVGTALHHARIDLLRKGNLSGLAYTPYCSMDLTLERPS